MATASRSLWYDAVLFGLSDTKAFAEEVFPEQVQLLYRNANTTLLVNLVIATAAVGVMFGRIPAAVWVTWLAALLLLTAARAWLIRACLRRPAADCEPRTWARRYLYGSFASGIVWGSMGILLEFYGSEHEHGFTAYILGGMAAGAIATNGALPAAYLSFMLPMLLPLNVLLYLRGDSEHLMIAALISFFIIVLVITLGRHHQIVRDSIAFRFEKEKILEELGIAHRQLHDMTADLAEGLFVLNSQGQVTFMNPEAERLLGWRHEELDRKKMHDLVHLHGNGENMPESLCAVGKALRQRMVFREEDELFRRKDGTLFPVAYIASPMNLPNGEPAVVVSFQDITVRKAMEERLSQLATHDDLTGLYNRRELERLLDEELVRAARYQRPLSVCMLDVDHFKTVNDSHGHDVGDEVLRELGRRIRKAIRTTDIATRYGGEEFTVILPETPLAEARAAAERLREFIAASPFTIPGGPSLDIRVSIGVATTSGEGASGAGLLKAADSALYKAKRSGRNRVCSA